MTEPNEHHTFKADEIPCQEISDPAVLSKNPLVSVKMITYNHEPYIAQAIEGVLMQVTNFPIELIIGEDCSTDRTREIVLDYQKKHPDMIRVITSEKNVGARKNGLRVEKACRGKYIAFCEGDDYWHHPEKLKKQIEFLEENPDYGMVHSDADWFYVEEGTRVKNYNQAKGYFHEDNCNIFQQILEDKYMIWTCTVCMRRDLLFRSRNIHPEVFSERFPMGDLQLWLETSRMAKIKYLTESLVTYNVLPNSASHSHDINKVINFTQSSLDLRILFIDKYECSEKIRNQVKRKYNNCLLHLAIRSKNAEIARAAWDTLKEIGIKPSWKCHLKYISSQNPVLYYAIQPLISVWKFAQSILY